MWKPWISATEKVFWKHNFSKFKQYFTFGLVVTVGSDDEITHVFSGDGGQIQSDLDSEAIANVQDVRRVAAVAGAVGARANGLHLSGQNVESEDGIGWRSPNLGKKKSTFYFKLKQTLINVNKKKYFLPPF